MFNLYLNRVFVFINSTHVPKNEHKSINLKMMKYLSLLPFLIFFKHNSCAQFKNTFAANGNPTTQIIDASGMKQGSWNYYDSHDRIFRVETYTDNVLTNNTFLLNGLEVNLMGSEDIQLSELNTSAIDFVTKRLQPIGAGEIIISSDGSVHLYFYLNKLKTKIPSTINLDPIKQMTLKKSIIKF
jgi:hypothetical protein